MRRSFWPFRHRITTAPAPVLAEGHVSVVIPRQRVFCETCGTELFPGTDHLHYEDAS